MENSSCAQPGENEHEINLAELPESCISVILSFTTPRDVCRLSPVSKCFTSAANSDFLWNKFIPQQCNQILPRAVTPVVSSSKRELYFRLCESILIDGGNKIFWLERSTTKIGYMLCARELTISWGNDREYWSWSSRYDSRFKELAELLRVCWLKLSGGIDTRLLSADTEYRVSFLLKFGENSRGWNARPIKFSLTMPKGEEMVSEKVLVEIEGERRRLYSLGWMEAVADDGWMDGWMDVVAGEFTVKATDDSASHIGFCMKEVESNQWKRGLLVDGVRIEPKSP